MNITQDRIKAIPNSPGVYLLKDARGKSIYIGKAKNLKNRLLSYINDREGIQRPNIVYLMMEAAELDYFVTRNEREALILENSLIKEKKPKYNIRLRDDKNYLSLKLDPRESFPRLSLTRRVLKDGAVYYGPFGAADTLKKAKKLIHKIFPLRDCTDEKFRRHSGRPCLNYYMGLCLGPCAGKANEEGYGDVVKQLRLFLKGKTKGTLRLLRSNMKKASNELRYEDAARYRDQIRLLEKNFDAQMFITPNVTDKDVVGFHREDQFVEFSVLFSRGGNFIDKAGYSFKRTAGTDEDLMEEFISQFYGGNRFIPNEIIVPVNIESRSAISEWLSERQGRKVVVRDPQRGERVKLVELANRNALEAFQRKHAERLSGLNLLERIQSSLHLKKLPVSIECFDISNTQGDMTVASLVRFENGKPAKGRYKKYRIKTVEGPNDYASMSEVLMRRFERAEQEGWEAPDLILVDGGKGQLNIARGIINEMGYLDKVDLASIAKGREEGDGDKIYKHGRKNPIIFSKNSKALMLLMRIRDEAHRFAITYHKQLRGKKALRSELDTVPGIGAKRKKEIIKHFGSISKIRNATVKEISAIPGFSKKLAETLQDKLSN